MDGADEAKTKIKRTKIDFLLENECLAEWNIPAIRYKKSTIITIGSHSIKALSCNIQMAVLFQLTEQG